MRTGGLLKGARDYLQWRADLQQASEMTVAFLRTPKRSQGRGHFLSSTGILKVAKFGRKPGEKDPSFSRGTSVLQIFAFYLSLYKV